MVYLWRYTFKVSLEIQVDYFNRQWISSSGTETEVWIRDINLGTLPTQMVEETMKVDKNHPGSIQQSERKETKTKPLGNTFKEGREEKKLRSAMRRGDQSASRKKIGDWYHRIQKNRKFQGGVVKIINRAKWTSNIRMKTARFILARSVSAE